MINKMIYQWFWTWRISCLFAVPVYFFFSFLAAVFAGAEAFLVDLKYDWKDFDFDWSSENFEAKRRRYVK